MARCMLSVVLATIVLFLWSGLTQLLPWGVSTVQNLTSLEEGDERFEEYGAVHVGALTTPDFDERFVSRVSTYTTGATFSWIVTQPLMTDYSGFFLREGGTQFLVASLLVLFLVQSRAWSDAKRMAGIALGGVVASVATYGQLMNWWALPASYGVGVSFNLVVGWTLAALPPLFLLRTGREQRPRAARPATSPTPTTAAASPRTRPSTGSSPATRCSTA